ncbi:DUF86 domain-containing protein [Patescibacteria group bacterium]|nr:DUF86 domain-containing protein [Patescibacteria group bacterium]
MKDDNVYIQQMLDAVRKIEIFTADMNRANFGSDEKTQSAVIMQLMLIGEISKKISVKTKSSIDLPWKDIAGFRDKAVHDYFEVDLDVVWNTIIGDVPILKSKLQTVKKF